MPGECSWAGQPGRLEGSQPPSHPSHLPCDTPSLASWSPEGSLFWGGSGWNRVVSRLAATLRRARRAPKRQVRAALSGWQPPGSRSGSLPGCCPSRATSGQSPRGRRLQPGTVKEAGGQKRTWAPRHKRAIRGRVACTLTAASPPCLQQQPSPASICRRPWVPGEPGKKTTLVPATGKEVPTLRGLPLRVAARAQPLPLLTRRPRYLAPARVKETSTMEEEPGMRPAASCRFGRGTACPGWRRRDIPLGAENGPGCGSSCRQTGCGMPSIAVC